MGYNTERVASFKRLSSRDELGVPLGTPVAAADFALSAGFGATATVSAVAAGSNDLAGEITITSAGAGQAANPTCTLTFKDGAWPAAPFVVVCRSGGSQPTVPFEVTTRNAGSVVLTFRGTPVAAETFKLIYQVLG